MSAAGAEHCPALVPLLQKKKVHTCSETDVPLDMGTASGANPVADLGPKQGAKQTWQRKGKHCLLVYRSGSQCGDNSFEI